MMVYQEVEFERILLELNGHRVFNMDGVIFPSYLYFFPNGLWLSYELDKKGRYVNIHLGRLFLFDDVKPRVMVLELLEDYYYVDMHKLSPEIKSDDFVFSFEKKELTSNRLKNYIQVILEHYSQIIENKLVQKNITKIEKKLKPFLLKDLSNCFSLEDELSMIKQTFTGKINKKDSNKVIKKTSKKPNILSRIADAFLEGIVELGILLVGILIGTLIFKDISNVSEEIFYLLGLCVFFVICLIMIIIYNLFKKKKKN